MKNNILIIRMKPSQASKTLRFNLPCSKQEFYSKSEKERSEIVSELIKNAEIGELTWEIYSYKSVETYKKHL